MTPRNGTSERSGRTTVRGQHGGPPREVERLSARIAELEDEKASLEAFAAVAAHEMLEPLVLAEAYAGMVSQRLHEDQAESRRDLEAVARGAARARLLVEAILHDARTADRLPRMESVDLRRTVDRSIQLLEPEMRARDARITVGELPVVRGEELLLGCVFTNLLVNALKYSPRQHCSIVVGAERESTHWCVHVSSPGPTIAPEERERIFGQFNRARGERRATGAGLGLAICRRIVERHGGTVSVAAANGSGNRFSFTLPI